MKSEMKQLFNNNIKDNVKEKKNNNNYTVCNSRVLSTEPGLPGCTVLEHSSKTLERDKSRCTVSLEERNSRVSSHGANCTVSELCSETLEFKQSLNCTKKKLKNKILKINRIHSTFIEEFLLDSF